MEPDARSEAAPLAAVSGLLEATNAHDPDAAAACFAVDYVNETPAHPLCGFSGRDQVRTNWTHIFSAVPDLGTRLLGTAVNGRGKAGGGVDDGGRNAAVDGEGKGAVDVWSEWLMTGTRRDGDAHEMAGVVIFSVHGGAITAARFFLEPVEGGRRPAGSCFPRAINQPGRPQPDPERALPGAARRGRECGVDQADTAARVETHVGGRPALLAVPGAGGGRGRRVPPSS
ncbi:nuclear transport factor 2 family protein [Arthrobacter sp. A5]|uniref:nuclear transport factor 2 family protein n=1 Tax=Arthrobacter sp. A5 TaxID=576926 RepID=UPI003DAA0F3D